MTSQEIPGYYPGLMGPRPGAPDPETQKEISAVVRAYEPKIKIPALAVKITEVPDSDKSRLRKPIPFTKRSSSTG